MMTVKKTLMIGVLLMAAAAATPAVAISYVIQGGKLMSITGIDNIVFGVAGDTSRYTTTVAFLDARCTDLTDNCNFLSNRSITSRRMAEFFDSVLVDNVIVDGVMYNFASNPMLYNGCSDSSTCLINSPAGYGRSSAITKIISSAGAAPAGTPLFNATTDTSLLANATFVRATIVDNQADAAAVPEPALWSMMITGFGAIGATMRRKRLHLTVAARRRA